MKQIEKEIVEFFTYEGTFLGNNPILARTIAYLLLYRELSQKDLVQLTGYSMSTISKALKKIEKLDLVEKTFHPSYQCNVYFIRYLSKGVASLILNSLKVVIEQEKTYKKIQQELNALDGNLKQTKGFEDLSRITNQFFEILPHYRELVQRIEKEMLNLIKEKDF